jgi:hypothetical protein
VAPVRSAVRVAISMTRVPNLLAGRRGQEDRNASLQREINLNVCVL